MTSIVFTWLKEGGRVQGRGPGFGNLWILRVKLLGKIMLDKTLDPGLREMTTSVIQQKGPKDYPPYVKGEIPTCSTEVVGKSPSDQPQPCLDAFGS